MIPEFIEISGEKFPLSIVKNPRSKRISLNFHPYKKIVLVNIPRSVSVKDGLKFLNQSQAWLARQVAKIPETDSITDGSVIPMLGNEMIIKHVPEAKRGVWVENNVIYVSGLEEYIHRRVVVFLREQAFYALTEICQGYCKQINKSYTRISIKDTKTRWGSRSSSGTLSFSWRLILAPYDVMDYVAAHEVAHIIHMNHSKDFWKLVEKLKPNYKQHKNWLKENGRELHVY